ncbi:DUF1697 domain-containing protein [Stenotrophomonas sp.]|uniref:DUF1697 domain-containing protein n=1 Tax=Stenotrophomonas sp. TaxID=69392 RepID=UPI002D417A26|nr:DUF1697 domain-containing protein [Stenotrophomonas sp.]HYQ21931.1 DUF1697 domain-containing protein [Stenotrophomonas sp.]
MSAYVALLRAVNVGGTGKLPMAALVGMCEDAGFNEVRTYIASGNVVFRSRLDEATVRDALAARLQAYAGRPVGVLVRSAAEIAEVAARNPFPDAAGNRVVALFVDGPLPRDPLQGVAGLNGEQLALGPRALHVHYGDGMADSRLRIPCAAHGTARNLNTVSKLAMMAAKLA